MASVIFRLMLGVLLITLFVSTFLREREKKAARRGKIKNGFGSAEDSLRDNTVFDITPALYDQMSDTFKDCRVIDDITVSDLGLRDIYRRMNRCLTSAGEDMLYCLFRLYGHDSGCRDDIRLFTEDADQAVELLYILDGYGIHKDCDDLKLIMSLKDAKTHSIVYDILTLAGLALSVVLVSFAPVYGFIALILMLIICIWTYFTGKRAMDDNLKGLALSLKLIVCAKKLLEKGRVEFLAYSELFACLKGNFLIPYKDRSASDPLSVILDYVRIITHVDLIAYNRKVSMLKKHVDKLICLYSDIGRLDASLAVASYICNKPHCEATVTDKCLISARAVYHPLVKDPVANDISSERGMLITGSNASGKSTFLKAVGINVLFAQSFGFAFAGSFETGRFSLYTSMALNDNILGGESYYVVEAKSIKRICDAAADGMCLCIIDEVLRGTNTIERIAASYRILKYLCMPDVLCFAATHDIELAHLLKEDMDLYHFTEEINDDNVTFPFVIQKGYSDKTNAIRLLAMLGFDENIVSSANSLVASYKETGKWVNEQ